MNSSVIYQIVRYDIPYAAGLYRQDGTFVQVFPSRRTFRDKTSWVSAWHIFGDETVVMYVRPRASETICLKS